MKKMCSILLCLMMLFTCVPTGMADEGPVSDNAGLSGLAVAGYDLDPAFDADTDAYTVNIPNEASSVEITATAADTAAILEINGTTVASGAAVTVDNLVVGDNPVAVEVTAADGIMVKTYNLTVKQAGEEELPQTLAEPYAFTVEQAGAGGLPQTPAAYAAGDYAKYAARMAVGEAHIAVINANGAVGAGGDNTYGQREVPEELSGVKVKAIAAGSYHTLALTEDGRVFAWGSCSVDTAGTMEAINLPSEVTAGQGNIKLIAAGSCMSAVVTNSNHVIVWGRDSNQLTIPDGLGNIEAIGLSNNCVVVLNNEGNVTVQGSSACCTIPDGLNGSAVAITVGMNHWLALKKDGTVSVTGDSGQLSMCGNIKNATDVRAIVGGWQFAGAILADGSVRGWGRIPAVSNLVGDNDVGYEIIAADANIKAFTCTVSGGVGNKPALCGMQEDGAIKILAPSEFTTAPITDQFNFLTVAGDNADLSGLEVAGYTLSPAFDSSTGAYTVNVPTDVSSVAITATTADSGATLRINGSVAGSGTAMTVNNLAEGDNLIPVAVTAPDFTTVKTYNLTVARQPLTESNNAYLSSLEVAGHTLDQAFDAATTVYTLTVPYESSSVEVTATTGASGAVMKINGAVATSGTAQTMNLAVGDELVTIEVTSADGTLVKTYTLTITRQKEEIQLPQIPADYAASDLARYASKMAMGYAHIAVVDAGGTMTLGGDDTYQQCSGVPEGLTGAKVKAVAAGTYHTLALTKDGRVFIWGSAVDPAGDGATISQVTAVPDEVTAVQGSIKLIAAGGAMSAVLTTTGQLIVWGYNTSGLSATHTGLSNITAVAVDSYCVVALDEAGNVTVWGDSACATAPDGLNGNVVAIATGQHHWLALKKNGTVSVTGDTTMTNRCGKIADQSDVRAIVGGWQFAGALLSDGSVKGWGRTPAGTSTPGKELIAADANIRAYTSIVSDGNKSAICAMQGDGTIKVVCSSGFSITPITDDFNFLAGADDSNNADLSGLAVAGYNLDKPFAADTAEYTVNVPNYVSSVNITATTADSGATLKINGTAAASGASVTVDNLAVGDNPLVVEVTAADGTTVKTYTLTIKRAGEGGLPQTPAEYAASDYARLSARLAAGASYTSVVLADGTVYAWGDNSFGQLDVPAEAAGVKALAAGNYHTLAINGDDTIMAWGDNSRGQCALPAALAGAKVKAIATARFTSAALTDDNKIYVWGQKGNAQLPESDKNLAAIALAGSYLMALAEDGTVSVWDCATNQACEAPDGFSGQIVAVAAGDVHFLALKADGSVVSTTEDGFYEYTVPRGLTGVRAISAGWDYSIALDQAGDIAWWGKNRYGELNIPSGLGRVLAMKGGLRDIIVLREDGTVVVWGINSNGQCNVPEELNLFDADCIKTLPGSLTDCTVSVESVFSENGVEHSIAGDIYPAISSKQAEGVVDVANEVVKVRVTVQPSGSQAGLEINGEPAVAGAPAAVDNLVVGDNPVVIKVMAENGCTRSYTLHVKRVSGDYALPQTPQAYQESEFAAYARKIAAGSGHSLALQKDGTIVAWGGNGNGKANVPGDLAGVVAMAAGGSHSLALKEDGTVAAWGDNRYGQCNVPEDLIEAADIAAGSNFSAALEKDGTVTAWGDNRSGQCDVPDDLGGVADIQCGGDYMLALKADGTVAAWGSNNKNQCDVPEGLEQVVAIAAGGRFGVALKADGTVATWGQNYNGSKQGEAFGHPGLRYVKAITASQYGAVALKWDGSLAVWGYYFDQSVDLGIPLELDRKVLAVSGNSNGVHLLDLNEDGMVTAWGDPLDSDNANKENQCSVPAGLNLLEEEPPYSGPSPDISQTPAAYAASNYVRAAARVCKLMNGVAVLNMDGTVKAAVAGPADFDLSVPQGLDNVTSIATTGSILMALRGDGTVVVWGYDGEHQSEVPTDLGKVTAIATGNLSSPYCLALQEDGTVAAWGGNVSGQCDVPADLAGVTAIAAGANHCLALKEDGTVRAWGNNTVGQCDVPAGLNNVARIYAGKDFSLALKDDGTVVAWGDNTDGQCDVPAGLSGVVDIAINSITCIALKSNGTVVVWGGNGYGSRNVPAGLHDVVAVSGIGGIMAVKSDGAVETWGNSSSYDTSMLTSLEKVLTGCGSTIIFRDGTLQYIGSGNSETDQINEALAGLNVLSGHYFAINEAELLNPAGQSITSVAVQGGYRIKASVANNNAAPSDGLTIIQVRGGSGVTSSSGGLVLGCVGLSSEIPVSGSTVSSDFTMPAGISGTACVDVFVWDGWDTMVPRAEARQDLSFSVTE